ncbi:ribonuclease inhibitor isoform X2 [Pseudorasbora parva]|uniref:ribonuclease inhibitor isoform X2 n=1 Tax=Pseudorasbora parva TaxID=51549 RepID=UPI00351F24EF
MRKAQAKGPREGVSSVVDDSVVLQLRALWRRYEHHCMQIDSCPSVVLKQDILQQIDKQEHLKKITLSFQDCGASDAILPSLQPLLMAIREERYTHAQEFHIWSLSLKETDIVELCLLLEKRGRTVYPFRSLELLDCRLTEWSLERLGRAAGISYLTKLCLDYTRMGQEGLKGLLSGGLGTSQICSLSLCYCGLGSWSGTLLASLLTNSSVRELYINGNELQCVGAIELLRTVADNSLKMAEVQNRTTSITGETELISQMPNMSPRKKKAKNKGKKKKKREKAKSGPGAAGGPWLEKLHMFDNSIDHSGKEGPNQLTRFLELLCILVKFSSHLTELDLGENHIGEDGGKVLLEALRERKAAKLSPIKIQVSTRMSTETFSAILKSAKELKSGKKRRKTKGKTK